MAILAGLEPGAILIDVVGVLGVMVGDLAESVEDERVSLVWICEMRSLGVIVSGMGSPGPRCISSIVQALWKVFVW